MNVEQSQSVRPVKLYRARSGVEGEGVFTRERIPAGAHILDCRGVLLTGAEVERAPDSLRVMQVGHDLYLAEDPENPGIDDFINHSCQPNVGFFKGTLSLHALRDIGPGEELFFDYSTCMNEEEWYLECNCGTPRCRRIVRSFCDLSKQERESLRGIALAYLLQTADALEGASTQAE